MFESFEAAEKNRGVKGFLARHFGPVIYLDLAEEGIREIGVVFMSLAVLSGIYGAVAHHNVRSLVAGLILAFVAFMLYLTRSRAAAVVLLVLSLLSALLALPALLPWVWVAFAARATQLTFGYHRLKRETAVALSALE
jgi:hypothetical protein